MFNKNIRVVAGKPLIYWCIKAALDSEMFRDVVVTSDSQEILDVASNYGALPITRPKHLATDACSVKHAIKHALKFAEYTHKYDYVQLLQPVTPLIDTNHIKTGFALLLGAKADIVISVCQSTEGLGISKPLPNNKSLHEFLPKSYRQSPRQALLKRYRLNNGIFVGKAHVFRDGLDFYSPDVKSFAYIMPKNVSVDIDDEYDLFIADALLREKYGEIKDTSKKSFWRHLRTVCFRK